MKRPFLSIAALSCFLLFSKFAFSNSENPPLDSIRQVVAETTRKRLGIVLIANLQTREEFVFGERNLLHRLLRPGSLFKLIVAETAVLQKKDFHYRCSGKDKSLPGSPTCWKPNGHGTLDLSEALARSCNLYFMNLGERLGRKSILRTLQYYPMLTPPQASESSSQWKDFMIGDSPLFRVTPSQMMEFWEAYLDRLEAREDTSLRQGLFRAAEQGTAKLASVAGRPILAKTGTADSESRAYATNAWILAAYPADQPRYAILIFLQEGHGFHEAAKLAGKIISRL